MVGRAISPTFVTPSLLLRLVTNSPAFRLSEQGVAYMYSQRSYMAKTLFGETINHTKAYIFRASAQHDSEWLPQCRKPKTRLAVAASCYALLINSAVLRGSLQPQLMHD